MDPTEVLQHGGPHRIQHTNFSPSCKVPECNRALPHRGFLAVFSGMEPAKSETREPIAKLKGFPISYVPSPSPQPSPLGRGRIIASRSANPGRFGSSRGAHCCALSPRERVGVRGNAAPISPKMPHFCNHLPKQIQNHNPEMFKTPMQERFWILDFGRRWHNGQRPRVSEPPSPCPLPIGWGGGDASGGGQEDESKLFVHISFELTRGGHKVGCPAWSRRATRPAVPASPHECSSLPAFDGAADWPSP